MPSVVASQSCERTHSVPSSPSDVVQSHLSVQPRKISASKYAKNLAAHEMSALNHVTRSKNAKKQTYTAVPQYKSPSCIATLRIVFNQASGVKRGDMGVSDI